MPTGHTTAASSSYPPQVVLVHHHSHGSLDNSSRHSEEDHLDLLPFLYPDSPLSSAPSSPQPAAVGAYYGTNNESAEWYQPSADHAAAAGGKDDDGPRDLAEALLQAPPPLPDLLLAQKKTYPRRNTQQNNEQAMNQLGRDSRKMRLRAAIDEARRTHHGHQQEEIVEEKKSEPSSTSSSSLSDERQVQQQQQQQQQQVQEEEVGGFEVVEGKMPSSSSEKDEDSGMEEPPPIRPSPTTSPLQQQPQQQHPQHPSRLFATISHSSMSEEEEEEKQYYSRPVSDDDDHDDHDDEMDRLSPRNGRTTPTSSKNPSPTTKQEKEEEEDEHSPSLDEVMGLNSPPNNIDHPRPEKQQEAQYNTRPLDEVDELLPPSPSAPTATATSTRTPGVSTTQPSNISTSPSPLEEEEEAPGALQQHSHSSRSLPKTGEDDTPKEVAVSFTDEDDTMKEVAVSSPAAAEALPVARGGALVEPRDVEDLPSPPSTALREEESQDGKDDAAADSADTDEQEEEKPLDEVDELLPPQQQKDPHHHRRRRRRRNHNRHRQSQSPSPPPPPPATLHPSSLMDMDDTLDDEDALNSTALTSYRGGWSEEDAMVPLDEVDELLPSSPTPATARLDVTPATQADGSNGGTKEVLGFEIEEHWCSAADEYENDEAIVMRKKRWDPNNASHEHGTTPVINRRRGESPSNNGSAQGEDNDKINSSMLDLDKTPSPQPSFDMEDDIKDDDDDDDLHAVPTDEMIGSSCMALFMDAPLDEVLSPLNTKAKDGSDPLHAIDLTNMASLKASAKSLFDFTESTNATTTRRTVDESAVAEVASNSSGSAVGPLIAPMRPLLNELSSSDETPLVANGTASSSRSHQKLSRADRRLVARQQRRRRQIRKKVASQKNQNKKREPLMPPLIVDHEQLLSVGVQAMMSVCQGVGNLFLTDGRKTSKEYHKLTPDKKKKSSSSKNINRVSPCAKSKQEVAALLESEKKDTRNASYFPEAMNRSLQANGNNMSPPPPPVQLDTLDNLIEKQTPLEQQYEIKRTRSLPVQSTSGTRNKGWRVDNNLGMNISLPKARDKEVQESVGPLGFSSACNSAEFFSQVPEPAPSPSTESARSKMGRSGSNLLSKPLESEVQLPVPSVAFSSAGEDAKISSQVPVPALSLSVESIRSEKDTAGSMSKWLDEVQKSVQRFGFPSAAEDAKVHSSPSTRSEKDTSGSISLPKPPESEVQESTPLAHEAAKIHSQVPAPALSLSAESTGSEKDTAGWSLVREIQKQSQTNSAPNSSSRPVAEHTASASPNGEDAGITSEQPIDLEMQGVSGLEDSNEHKAYETARNDSTSEHCTDGDEAIKTPLFERKTNAPSSSSSGNTEALTPLSEPPPLRRICSATEDSLAQAPASDQPIANVGSGCPHSPSVTTEHHPGSQPIAERSPMSDFLVSRLQGPHSLKVDEEDGEEGAQESGVFKNSPEDRSVGAESSGCSSTNDLVSTLDDMVKDLDGIANARRMERTESYSTAGVSSLGSPIDKLNIAKAIELDDLDVTDCFEECEDGMPAMVESVDSEIGIPKGDMMISLLNHDRSDALSSSWTSRVDEAIWRCRSIRRDRRIRWGEEKATSKPGEKSRASVCIDLDDGHVFGGVESIANTQKAALKHLKYDDFGDAVVLFEDIYNTYSTYADEIQSDEERLGKLKKYQAAALHNLGIVQLLKGDHEDALSSFEHATELRTEIDDTGNVDHVASLVKMAMTHFALEDYSAAYSELGEALSLSSKGTRTLSGVRQLAEITNNLGCLAYTGGEIEQSMLYFQESLELHSIVSSQVLYIGSKSSSDSSSLNMSITRANIAFISLVMRDMSRSVSSFESALRDQLLLLLDAHLTLVTTMEHLVVACLLAGQKRKATQLLRRVLCMQEESYGHEDGRCMATRTKLALLESNEEPTNYDIESIPVIEYAQEDDDHNQSMSSAFKTLREQGQTDIYFV